MLVVEGLQRRIDVLLPLRKLLEVFWMHVIPGKGMAPTLLKSLFLLVVLSVVSSVALADEAKRVILLETMQVPVVRENSRWFIRQMEELGYIQGENLVLHVIDMEGDKGKGEQLLGAALAAGKPDLVLTSATLASQTAWQMLAGTETPMVFFTVSDPVGAGIIEKAGVAGGKNITGIINSISPINRVNLALKLLERPANGKPVRIGIVHSSYPSSVSDVGRLMAIGAHHDEIEFVVRRIDYRRVPEGLPEMLSEVKQVVSELSPLVDFWWEPLGPLGEVESYTRTLLENSDTPILMGNRMRSVELGALLLLSPSSEASGREAALLADAVLKGKPPGEIAPNPAKRFDIGINLSTALRLGITIPPDIFKLAGKNIYR
ncbi:MAG: ABC transporter substrate binding protein [Sedimenticola sp.]